MSKGVLIMFDPRDPMERFYWHYESRRQLSMAQIIALGSVARRYLTLPVQGYHFATSIHADTIDDVISMYHHDLHLRAEDVRRLGLVVNIGLVGHSYPMRRRWLTTHFLQPDADLKHPDD